MIFAVVAIWLASILLSAFFSGLETGFYRLTRLRLVIEAVSGDRTSRILLWFSNNPTMFIATALIGNNVANYLTSLSIVLGTQWLLGTNAAAAELMAPILLAPILFVYGELLPKNICYQAPNRMLRRGGLLFVFCAILFAPLSLVLWGLGKLLEKLFGQTPGQTRLSLARRELRQAFKQGEDVGVLKPSQRELASNLIAVAKESVARFCVPVSRIPSVSQGSRVAEAKRLARRNRMAVLPVRHQESRELIGYVPTYELYLHDIEQIQDVHELIEVAAKDSMGAALITMQSQRETLAKVIDDEGQTVGLVSSQSLMRPLLTGELTSMRR